MFKVWNLSLYDYTAEKDRLTQAKQCAFSKAFKELLHNDDYSFTYLI